MNFFKKRCLGIDVGVASTKIVEISSFGGKKKLENYAEFIAPTNSAIKTFEENNLILKNQEASEIIQAILQGAKIKEGKAAIAIPDFSTFFTSFDLPPMDKKEIPQAIEFEARHHIPLSLDEVNFDWQILEKKETFPGLALKVLLVAVPKKILQNYQKMAVLSKVQLKGIEAEVFGLIHSSVPENKYELPVCLVDFGWQSTTVSIVEKEALRESHSFDISSGSLTKSLISELKISAEEAERLKKENGLDLGKKEVAEILTRQIDSLIFEIEKVLQEFHQNENKNVNDIILAGGSAKLFGLKEYLGNKMKKQIYIADPFSKISYPSVLESRLKEIGPSFAVAVGVAMMGIES